MPDRSIVTCAVLASLLALAAPASAQPSSGDGGWRAAERGRLERHVQLTTSERFIKAGESYFSPDGTMIVFQAIEVPPEGEAPEAHYQMYVADVVRDRGGRLAGISGVTRLSPPGSSNTCGWFHPTRPGYVIFGSTIVPPSRPDRAGYQRGTSRYKWQFAREMTIVGCDVATADGTAASLETLLADDDAYLAECSLTRDGRHLLYCRHVEAEGETGGDLLVTDLSTGVERVLIDAPGYDGGPFFSPEDRRICYRSDRRGDKMLQIFVADLGVSVDGAITGIAREHQLTDNAHVNWAPFWHPSGRFLVYTTSEMGHQNYEVFVVDADPGTLPGSPGPMRYGTKQRRVTEAAGFDGLPVFDATGRTMMWTSQRGADGSSQLWAADFVMPLDRAAPGASPPADDTMHVEDPATGLVYIYDLGTHELSAYDPRTHEKRPVTDPEEVRRATSLFSRDAP